ncbi:MAG: selenide, water dikinase SelD [Chloroflexaceae bacterium]|jgi:selenide, water dikinase|nr:selenide, water dikinase SelD [Chloroflexaceae bacterium]
MGPGALQQVIQGLRIPTHPALIVGLEYADDAAVYQINEQTTIVQTVDFFPPIVDDAYDYGYIAATNALSDIYAMGGTPILAMAIAGFPETLAVTTIQRILQGGIDAVTAAGAVVVGGHTIVDAEPKYGLCVTGTITPAAIARKRGVQIGDRLVLTKALGTGIITTAAKRQLADAATFAAACASMKHLNRTAATLATAHAVHTMTDVTGFGLLGHLLEMVSPTTCGVRIDMHALPLLPGVQQFAESGVVPGGLARNRLHVLSHAVTVAPHVPPWLLDVACDPQTSGGLLCAVAPAQLASFCEALQSAGEYAAVIAEIVAEPGMVLC